MKKLGYSILLKKYFLIDLGVLLLLTFLPLYIDPEELNSIVQRALFYSGFITPVISYLEIKKSNLLPFFDNIGVFQIPFYISLLVVKILLSISIALYV